MSIAIETSTFMNNFKGFQILRPCINLLYNLSIPPLAGSFDVSYHIDAITSQTHLIESKVGC